MLRIGVTGGIGTGKSMVCRIFETMNIPVFYADEESKKILFTNKKVIDEVRKIFGEEIVSDNIPDKRKIAEVVFNDPEKLRELNAVLHPATFKYFNRWSEKKKDVPYLIMEAALIYETGIDKILDKVITVSTPDDIRIRRTMERDHLSEEEVKSRMRNQLDPEAIKKRSDFALINDEEQLIIPQLYAIHEQLFRLSSSAT